MTVPSNEPLRFARGPAMRNRMMLAPLTNLQSNPDGTLSDDEFRWLLLRAQGGFGLTMTCATSVQLSGRAFAGQLGIHSDIHIPGLARLAKAINAAGSVSSVQLHHGGWRAKRELTGEAPHSPWDDAETGARAISTGEVEQLVEDFILAGLRAEKAGFHGIELHGAHGYLLCQFLNAERNLRSDKYGGSFENRSRVLLEVVSGLRARAGAQFQIGVRLSPENYGIPLEEARTLAQLLLTGEKIDYLDMSLWDAFKEPLDKAYAGKPLIDYFTGLTRGSTRLGAAGKIMTAEAVRATLEHEADFAIIGRGAILHRDFPRLVMENPQFEPVPRPVTRAYLREQGVGPAFVEYLDTWKGFLAQEERT